VLENVRIILEMIDEAVEKHSAEMKRDVDVVEDRLVHLRDYLIDRQREQTESATQSATLKRINIALSLIISIGYPGAGIDQVGLEETRDMFREYFYGETPTQHSPSPG